MRGQLPLPAELRQQIYGFVFAATSHDGDHHCKIHYLWTPPGGTLYDACATPLDLSLLLVSRQTYLEAADVFYRINRLDFNDCDVMYTFLKNIGLARRQSITAVSFSHCGQHVTEAMELLKSCSGLRSMEVYLSTDPLYDDDLLKGLIQLRGLAEVKFTLTPCPYPRVMGRPPCYCDGPVTNLRLLREIMMRPRESKLAGDGDPATVIT